MSLRRPNLNLPGPVSTSGPTTGSPTESDDAIRAEIRARSAETRRRTSSVPPALRALEFSDLEPSDGRGEVILALQAWSVQGGGMYLFGPQGTGKTRMAATAAWAMLERRPVSWVVMPAAATATRADFADPSRRVLDLLARPVALVLDDLGQEQHSESIRALLHSAIDLRIASGLPLLVTSNFLPSHHGDRYGAWLASRLTGYCRAYRVLGRDRRLLP